MKKFECDRCGLCCQNLRLSEIYHTLDRGDGVCKYFDVETKLCTIYEHRPLICNVDEYYDKYLKDEMNREEFHRLNRMICQKLKQSKIEE